MRDEGQNELGLVTGGVVGLYTIHKDKEQKENRFGEKDKFIWGHVEYEVYMRH